MAVQSNVPAAGGAGGAAVGGQPAGAVTGDVDNPQGMGLFHLVTSVITLVVGAGVFSLCGDMEAAGADGQAILIAWAISGVGVLCLVLTFYTLNRLHPELKGGIYSYARAGFGALPGFCSAWGYWISSMFTTLSFSALLFSALAYFFPVFDAGNNLASIIGASVIIWFYAWVVSRGVTEAAAVNAVVTISKLVPILVAIVAIIFLGKFNPDVFMANLHVATVNPDTGLPMGGFDKVTAALTTTIWVFVGVEGAVAISGRAKHSRDVGRATVIAFVCVLALYLIISLLSLGVLPVDELAALENPPMANLMQAAVGDWGALLINFGVALSIIGAMLGYQVLTSEVSYEATVQGAGFPSSFAKTNKNGAPIVTLVVSNIIVEIFLVVMMLSDSTYQFFYSISAGMILLPYLLSAAYLTQIAIKHPDDLRAVTGNSPAPYVLLGIVGVVYSLLLCLATGAVGITIMSFLYAPGLVVFCYAKHKEGKPMLEHTADKVAAAIIVLALVVSIYMLATGQII